MYSSRFIFSPPLLFFSQENPWYFNIKETLCIVVLFLQKLLTHRTEIHVGFTCSMRTKIIDSHKEISVQAIQSSSPQLFRRVFSCSFSWWSTSSRQIVTENYICFTFALAKLCAAAVAAILFSSAFCLAVDPISRSGRFQVFFWTSIVVFSKQWRKASI